MRPKIAVIGAVRFSETEGLQCSVTTSELPTGIPAELARFSGFELQHLSELQPGDFVTHVDHGVGVYIGLKRFRAEGNTNREFVEIQYLGDDRLFVPIDRIDLLSKHSGERPLKLSELRETGKRPDRKTYWFEPISQAYNWPAIGTFPGLPNRSGVDAMNAWRAACRKYFEVLHADEDYRKAAKEFVDLQTREPQPVRFSDRWWAYRFRVLEVTSPNPTISRSQIVLFLKRFVLREEREHDKLRREVEVLENFEKVAHQRRGAIPDDVRLFVWQRDKGSCVKCGSRERLEFDHIIPLSAGGSSTERNIQLLCESCNRSKSTTV
jgi:hypothetical protein